MTSPWENAEAMVRGKNSVPVRIATLCAGSAAADVQPLAMADQVRIVAAVFLRVGDALLVRLHAVL